MIVPVEYDLDEEYRNALNKDADKQSRLISISRLNFMHPLDELVLDDEEDVEIRIAALDCLELGGYTLYDIDIDDVPKELALAVIDKYYFSDTLSEVALSNRDDDFRLAAVKNRKLEDEDTLRHIIEYESNSQLRAAAASHPFLNDGKFLESIALNDDDVNVRAAAASNYSIQNIETLKKIISDDEDIVRISALKNLVSKYLLFYPSSNRKYDFKRKFDKVSRYLIGWREDNIPKEMNNDMGIVDYLDFELLRKIYRHSTFEEYDDLRDDLIEYLEKILLNCEKYNPFDEGNMKNGLFKKELYDDLKIVYGDERELALYQIGYEGCTGELKYHLDYLKSLDYNSYIEKSNSSKNDYSIEKPIDESFFIDLASEDYNPEIVRLALEAISDNCFLMKFAERGQTRDIIETAFKGLTDSILLVDLAINRVDYDIHEANFYDEDWICDYISNNLDDFDSLNTYDFYSHDLKHYSRLFDNRLESHYYDMVAEHYYRDTLSYCIFKKIQNYFDLIHVLKYTRSFALRDLIIYKIDNPIVLADIALNAIDERIRYVAFGRIRLESILKYVYLNSEDFRIKLLYLSNSDDNEILNEAFLKEENDVLCRSILDNPHFVISPKVIEHCIGEDSSIASYAERKFAKQFVDYRLLNRKFKN